MSPVWDNFFVEAGTAAATPTGLLFVAVTVGTGFSTSKIEAKLLAVPLSFLSLHFATFFSQSVHRKTVSV